MSRSRFNRLSSAQSTPYANRPSEHPPAAPSSGRFLGQTWGFWAVRLALVGLTSILCYPLAPFGFHSLPAAGLGFLMAMVILLAELRLRRAEISGLMGGTVGAVLGLLAALLITLVISHTAQPEPTKSSSNSPHSSPLVISVSSWAPAKATLFARFRCRVRCLCPPRISPPSNFSTQAC